MSDTETIERLKFKLADLERENQILGRKILNADAKIIELTRQRYDLIKERDELSKAMAKVETMNRELKKKCG